MSRERDRERDRERQRERQRESCWGSTVPSRVEHSQLTLVRNENKTLSARNLVRGSLAPNTMATETDRETDRETDVRRGQEKKVKEIERDHTFNKAKATR
jgi:hypothetical protein